MRAPAGSDEIQSSIGQSIGHERGCLQRTYNARRASRSVRAPVAGGSHRRHADPEVLDFPKQVVQQVMEDEVPDLAAGLSYRFLFAVFPFGIFLAALAAFVAQATGLGDPTQQILCGDRRQPSARRRGADRPAAGERPRPDSPGAPEHRRAPGAVGRDGRRLLADERDEHRVRRRGDARVRRQARARPAAHDPRQHRDPRRVRDDRRRQRPAPSRPCRSWGSAQARGRRSRCCGTRSCSPWWRSPSPPCSGSVRTSRSRSAGRWSAGRVRGRLARRDGRVRALCRELRELREHVRRARRRDRADAVVLPHRGAAARGGRGHRGAGEAARARDRRCAAGRDRPGRVGEGRGSEGDRSKASPDRPRPRRPSRRSWRSRTARSRTAQVVAAATRPLPKTLAMGRPMSSIARRARARPARRRRGASARSPAASSATTIASARRPRRLSGVRIALVSDTHLPRFGRALPRALLDGFEAAAIDRHRPRRRLDRPARGDAPRGRRAGRWRGRQQRRAGAPRAVRDATGARARRRADRGHPRTPRPGLDARRSGRGERSRTSRASGRSCSATRTSRSSSGSAAAPGS